MGNKVENTKVFTMDVTYIFKGADLDDCLTSEQEMKTKNVYENFFKELICADNIDISNIQNFPRPMTDEEIISFEKSNKSNNGLINKIKKILKL